MVCPGGDFPLAIGSTGVVPKRSLELSQKMTSYKHRCGHWHPRGHAISHRNHLEYAKKAQGENHRKYPLLLKDRKNF